MKHTAGSCGKWQVLGVSVEEVVCAEISQDRRRRLAVATKDVDQSIRQLGELRRTVKTQRAVMGVNAATQSTYHGMETCPRTAKNTYKTTPTCRQTVTAESQSSTQGCGLSLISTKTVNVSVSSPDTNVSVSSRSRPLTSRAHAKFHYITRAQQ